jgi:hypothetical protein
MGYGMCLRSVEAIFVFPVFVLRFSTLLLIVLKAWRGVFSLYYFPHIVPLEKANQNGELGDTTLRCIYQLTLSQNSRAQLQSSVFH